MILDIVTYPDPRLKQKSQKAVFDDNLTELVKNMLDTMNSFKDPEAAGLSAIQVGVPTRVLIARNFSNNKDETDKYQGSSTGNNQPNSNTISTYANISTKDLILINPRFISMSKEKELDWEGCLSFPDLYGKIWRAKKVKVKYQNLQGDEQRLTASGFLARVIQHEMDHLDGITFDTRIVGKMYKGEELEKGNGSSRLN